MALRYRGQKYGAKKTEVDGITFDSEAEANYYRQLKMLKRAGEIEEFTLQPRFEIIEPYVINGKKVRATYYVADFEVLYKDGNREIIDVKGFKTEAYKIKKKLFESKYRIPIREVSA